MNESIKAGSDIHAGDGGYSLGTQEKYDEFVKGRDQSMGKMRIRQLAEQAGEYVNEVYTPPVRSKTPGKIWEDGHVGWHTQFNQKFAELIVAECMRLNSKELSITAIERLLPLYREHFGVEE